MLAKPDPDIGPGATGADELFTLGARPELMIGAGSAWQALAAAAETVGADVAAAAQHLFAGWEGESARAYRTHQADLVESFRAVRSVAASAARTIDDAALVVGAAQARLDDARQRRDVDAADDIRADADQRLAMVAGDLDRERHKLWPSQAVLAATGEAAPWLPGPGGYPELATAGQVIVDGDRVVINASGRDDDIRVSVDPRSGEQFVRVAGSVRRFSPSASIVIRAGSGDDRIAVAPGSAMRMTILAGAGDDTVRGGAGDETVLGMSGRDTVWGGAGADLVSGGADADYLDGQGGDDRLHGGSGNDTLYGLDGADDLWGGWDRDYIDGSAGADVVAGGADADVLAGGRGIDTVLGGSGDDVLYAGSGNGRVNCGPGDDRMHTDFASAAGGFIRVQGSAEFVARVESDLDTLRSSPRGTAMLTALDASHVDSGLLGTSNGLVIRETEAANGFARPPLLGLGNASIEYNPAFDDLPLGSPVPPIVVLYHELAHVYDYFNHTLASGIYMGAENPGVPNLEREAVGLPIDHDGDPATPEAPYASHPFEFTENGLRDEFRLPPRPRY